MTAVDAGKVRGRDAKARQRNLTRLEARANSERARKEFAGTLNALEDKLNVPKQVRASGATTTGESTSASPGGDCVSLPMDASHALEPCSKPHAPQRASIQVARANPIRV